MKRVIYTNDPQLEIWSLLGLFESKKIVYDKLKLKYPSLSEDGLITRTDEITYSVRQAREFFSASDQTSLLTRPLLLSYGMLNLGKALVCYKSSEDTNFENYFMSHGLKFMPSTGDQELANESIKIKDKGTYPELAAIYNQQAYPNVEINLKDLLSQIPDLAEMFSIVYKEHPNVVSLKVDKYGYLIEDLGEYFEQFNEKIKATEPYLRDNKVEMYITGIKENIIRIDTAFERLGVVKTLKHLDLSLSSISGVDYFRVFTLINSEPIILKEASIHYLIIFSYGMLSRYQSSRWGKYIDPNLSGEAEIINKSIQVGKIRYLHLLVSYLFEEEFQFSNSIEKPEESVDYEEIKRRLKIDAERDKRRGPL